jgi:carbonic anhydrase
MYGKFKKLFYTVFMHTCDEKNPCKAIVVTCMDYRLQTQLRDWVVKKIGSGHFDRLSLAGAAKNLAFITEQIALSHSLHHIHTVYLINHEDCGAYGKEGTFEKHKHDLLLAKKILSAEFPDIEVVPYYETLKGEFVEVK